MAQPFVSCQSQTRLQPPVVDSSESRGQVLELHSQQLEQKQQLQSLPSPPQPSDAGGSTTTSTPVSAPLVNTTVSIAADTTATTAAAEAEDVRPKTSNGKTKSSSTVQDIDPAGHDIRAPAVAAGDSIEHLHNSQPGPWPDGASSPAMSNTQPPHGPPRHPVGYSNTAYPPSSMPQHYVYPPQPGPHADVYRGNAPVNSPMTLPNIRSLDPNPLPPQHHGLPIMGTMAPTAPPLAYYNIPPPNPYIHQDSNGMRYAIPPNLVADPRIALSGGRHKKEIKRRTKTGCLTCRKRRIKCDEGHPTCNNCKKSKRECLGYDPIFKPQPQPHPSPASSSMQLPLGPTSQASPATTFAPTPTVPSSAPQLPYHTPVVPSSYPPSTASPDSPTPPASRSVKSEGGFDYQGAIDPALQLGGDTTSSSGAQFVHPHYKPEPVGHSPGLIVHARGTATLFLDTRNTPCLFGDGYQSDQGPFSEPGSPAKQMKVDELIGFGGPDPPADGQPPSPATLEDIVVLYFEIYVPGINTFLETQWYALDKGANGAMNPTNILLSNQPVINLFSNFHQTISSISTTDAEALAPADQLESRLVWALINLPNSVPAQDPANRPLDQLPVPDDQTEVRARVSVFSALLSGEALTGNPLTPPPTSTEAGLRNRARVNELQFWYYLGQYLQLANSSIAKTRTREHCLAEMRGLLEGRENRDVLYSVAVLREYTQIWDPAAAEQAVPEHLDETNLQSKLAVATRFIRETAEPEVGGTNVVRRLAELAYRAYVDPGVNVNKHLRGDVNRRLRGS